MANIIKSIKFGAKTFGRTVSKHVPELCMVGGTVMLGAAVYKTVKGTIKVEHEVVIPTEKKLADLEEKFKRNDIPKGKHDEEVKTIRRKASVDSVKAFAPAIGFALGSVLLYGVGYGVLKKRNAALAISLNGVTAAFNKYRQRVVDEQGAVMDHHYRFGTPVKKVKVKDENGEEHEEVQFDRDAEQKENDILFPSYVYEFSSTTSSEWSKGPGTSDMNWDRIVDVEDWANRKLRVHHRVFLNECLGMLGLKESLIGQTHGWASRDSEDPEDEFRRDGYVSFFGPAKFVDVHTGTVYYGARAWKRICENQGMKPHDIMNQTSYMLEFNCDGDIASDPRMWERTRPFGQLFK